MSPTIDSIGINGPTNMADISLDNVSTKPNNNPFGSLGTPSRFLGSSTWGTGSGLNRNQDVSLPMGSLNWDLLGGGQNDSTSNGNQQQLNKPSTFLSLSPLPVGEDRSTWGTSRFGGGLNGLGGSHLTTTQTGIDGANAKK